MGKNNGKPRKPPTITDEYKILQELKKLVDVLKVTNDKLELLCNDVKRNRGF